MSSFIADIFLVVGRTFVLVVGTFELFINDIYEKSWIRTNVSY